jgi:hypothetical protein
MARGLAVAERRPPVGRSSGPQVDGIIPPGTNVTSYCTLYERICRAVNKPEPLGPF